MVVTAIILGAGAAAMVEAAGDQRLGLQSPSVMANKIKKAAAIVSSACFRPSIASSCVVLVVRIVDACLPLTVSLMASPPAVVVAAARKWAKSNTV